MEAAGGEILPQMNTDEHGWGDDVILVPMYWGGVVFLFLVPRWQCPSFLFRRFATGVGCCFVSEVGCEICNSWGEGQRKGM